jgi:hypothetical protein
MINVVSFSGGRTSAYLVYLIESIKEQQGFEVEYIFMDTGAEHPETYKFIKRVVKEFDINLTCLRTVVIPEMGKGCRYEVVNLDDCTNDLKPFKDVVRKYGVPKNHMPHCTLHMKTSPFKKYCADKFGKGNYITWLGIRIDEPRRIKKDVIRTKYMASISDFDNDDVLNWWGEQSFDLGFDINSGWLGNCVFCHKKTNSKLALAARDEPELLKEFDDMVNSDDARQLGYTPKDQLYRQGRTIHDIIATFSMFDKDEMVNKLRHSKRFDNSPCSESCEVFGEGDIE